MSSGSLFIRYITKSILDEAQQALKAPSPNEAKRFRPVTNVVHDIERGLHLYDEKRSSTN